MIRQSIADKHFHQVRFNIGFGLKNDGAIAFISEFGRELGLEIPNKRRLAVRINGKATILGLAQSQSRTRFCLAWKI